MLEYLRLFVWSFGVAVGPVISPGAVSVTVVTEGARRGFRVGPLISTGHALMELLMVGVLALGMGQVLQYPLLAAAIGVLGGIFLLWMGGSLGGVRCGASLGCPNQARAAAFKRIVI